MPTVIHSVNPYLEPTTVWIYDQIRSLERYTPIVYTRNARNVDRFPVERLIDFTDASGLLTLSDRVVTRLRGTYPRYGRQAIRDNADLIHAHFGQEGYRCLEARRTAGVPLVTTFYGLDVSALPSIPIWAKRFGRLFAEGDVFLAEGPHMASCLVDIGCPEHKVRVQPLGIDVTSLPYRGPAERAGSNEILMYASLREKKGHVYGIDAFHRLGSRYSDLRLTIIGDGPLRGELEEQVRSLGLDERVTFLGNLPHDVCKTHLQRAGMLLYPSVMASDGDTEGGAPVGILEALAAGLPVVSTRHADIPFVTGDGEAALLVEEGDVDGLRGAMERSLMETDVTEDRCRAGRRLIEARHTMAAQGRALEAHYDSLIGA